MASALEQFVADHDDLSINETGKVQCISTKHEFGTIDSDTSRLRENIDKYLSGKKYKLAKECYSRSFDHYDYIIPNKTHPKKLFCTLCSFQLNRIPKQVEAHVNGRRHQFRVRDQEQPKEPETIPDRMAKELGEDGSEDIEYDEELMANIVEPEATFEVVSQNETDQDVNMNTSSNTTGYNSSSDEEETTGNGNLYLVGKRTTPPPGKVNVPRKKKSKRK